MIPKRILLTWLENLAFPVSCLTILFGLIVLANAVWYFVSGPPTPDSSFEYVETNDTQDVSSDVEVIVSANLFGIAGLANPTQEVIQNTNLRLQLHGTVVAVDPSKSVALISTQSQRQPKLFKVNGTVAGIARLEEIQSHRVILSRGGKKEQLLYSNSESLIKPSVVHDESNAPEKALESTEVRIEDGSLTQSKLEHLIAGSYVRKTFGESPEYLEYGVDFDLPNGERYGLQEGDKILSINDVPIPELDLDKDRSKLAEVSENNRFKIEINRNQRRFSIEIPAER